MAITYTNYFKTVLEALRDVIQSETNLPVYADPDFETRATQYFNLTPISSSLLNQYNTGENREYEVEIRYYLRRGAYEKHKVLDYTTAMAERIIRLFNKKDNAGFTTLTSSDFNEGVIQSVNYQPDRTPEEEDEEINIVEFTFVGRVTESH